jgi:hypothetical protein
MSVGLLPPWRNTYVTDMMDETFELCALWKRRRDNGRESLVIREAILKLMADVTNYTRDENG